MKSILDPTFKYVPALKTDLRETFKRIREEMKKAEPKQDANVRALPTIGQRNK